MIAMSNSGGGLIIVGVNDDGTAAEHYDPSTLLSVDPADITNKIHSYTDHHFATFDIVPDIRNEKPVAVIDIGASDIPILIHRSRSICSSRRRPEGRIRERKRLFSARRKERTRNDG
jgi:hypothetical protein